MSGQDYLLGRIVVGDHQRSRRLRSRLQQCPYLVGAGDDRQHGAVLALARLRHQHAAHPRRGGQVLSWDDTSGGKGGDLPEAVAGGGVRGHAQHVEQRELREAGGGNGRLRVLHRGEFSLLCTDRRRVERRLGEHDPMQIGEITIEPVPHGEGFGELQGEIGAHPHVLAALTGKDERRLTGARRTQAQTDVGVLELRGRTVGQCLAQFLGKALK